MPRRSAQLWVCALRRRRRGYRHRVLTFVVLIFAEVLPKTIAALYPEKVAYPSSFLLAPLQILMMPLVWLLNTITRLLMRLMGIKTDIVVSGSLSKEELRTIVHESRSQISRRNQDMLLSVLDLEKVSVDDIMVPRNEIIGIDINDDWKSIERQLTTRRTDALCSIAIRWMTPSVCCAYVKPGG
nr:Hemolysins-related protein containing CBS domains [Salmonella sp. NCTC 7297]